LKKTKKRKNERAKSEKSKQRKEKGIEDEKGGKGIDVQSHAF